MAPVADASSESLRSFVLDNVEPGATVITDAWQGYRWLEKNGYIHDRRSQRAASARGEDPGELLPGVHRIASLAKRWLLGTHQGAVDSAHLPSYLDEFVFRFNRRRSRSRGMLFYRILERALKTIDQNPDLLKNLLQPVGQGAGKGVDRAFIASKFSIRQCRAATSFRQPGLCAAIEANNLKGRGARLGGGMPCCTHRKQSPRAWRFKESRLGARGAGIFF